MSRLATGVSPRAHLHGLEATDVTKLTEGLDDEVVVEFVETFGQVQVDNPAKFVLADEGGHFRYGLVTAPSRPIGIARRMEMR